MSKKMYRVSLGVISMAVVYVVLQLHACIPGNINPEGPKSLILNVLRRVLLSALSWPKQWLLSFLCCLLFSFLFGEWGGHLLALPPTY